MDNSLAVALGISAVGMTLLFLALAFFYGLLSLMTAAIKDRPAGQQVPQEAQDGGTGEKETLLQAAAVAVAMARAEAEQVAGSVTVDEADRSRSPSPWWALHHQRELTPSPNPRRAR